MKKKILIVLPTLSNGGGVISGLKNMLALLPPNYYDIKVLPIENSVRNIVHLNNCTILKENLILIATNGTYENCKEYKNKYIVWLLKVLLNLAAKIYLRSLLEKILYKHISRSYKGYDIVISYQEGGTTYFTQHIESPHRIAWIHCDYAKYYELHKCRNEESMYSKYNLIVCVSKYTLNNFVSIYPKLKERSTFVYNLLDIETIRENSLKAFTNITFENNITNIVSIGRINPVKQFHLIPQIISKILNSGVSKFRWILIGGVDSGALEQINKEVEKYGITEEHFKYIGPQFNPYPYIKNSDILVSTSSSEACPFVVNEARVLGVPVVSNNYPSIYEFIKDDVNGKICTIDKMATILSNLIKNEKSLALLKQGMKEDQYNNAEIIKQICNLLDK